MKELLTMTNSYFDEYGYFWNKYFRVKSINVSQAQPISVADPYSFYPKYVESPYEPCEATIQCDNQKTMYDLLNYLKTYNENSDYSQSIDSLKHDYEEEINYIKEKYNALLEEVKELRKKKYIRYKTKHKILYKC